MMLQIFFNKKITSHQLQNLKCVLQDIRKTFSSSNVATGRKRPECCKKDPETPPKIITPGNCRELKVPFSTPDCCVGIAIGGSDNGFGYVAAEQLLENGAKRVILVDDCAEAGQFAAERLCNAYGKDRAKFCLCDVKNSCHVAGIFTSSICRDEIVSIVFNDLDAIHNANHFTANYCGTAKKVSNASRVTKLGIEYLARTKLPKEHQKIIVNCASILGFMGWPEEVHPVYCNAEYAAEVTMNAANKCSVAETGTRIVALCPSNRMFESIGLPIIPDDSAIQSYQIDQRTCLPVSCSPDPSKDKTRMGTALVHLMANAENGSVWFLDPPFSLRELPRLITFPKEGETTDATKKKDVPVAPTKKEKYKSECICK